MNIIFSPFPYEYINFALGKVKETIKKDKYRKIYIFVSEQRKLYFENLLFEKTAELSFLNVEVTSYKRFLYHILNEIGSIFSETYLDEASNTESLLYFYLSNKQLKSRYDLSALYGGITKDKLTQKNIHDDFDDLIKLKSEIDVLFKNGFKEAKIESILDDLIKQQADNGLILRLEFLLNLSKKYKEILSQNHLYDNSDSLETLLEILSKFNNICENNYYLDDSLVWNFFNEITESDFYFLGNAESRFTSSREIQLFELIDKISHETYITAEINQKALDEVLLNQTWSLQSFFSPAEKMIASLIKNNKIRFYNANIDNNSLNNVENNQADIFRNLAKKWYNYNSFDHMIIEENYGNEHTLKEAFSIIEGKSFENTINDVLGIIKYLNKVHSIDFKDVAICHASNEEENIQTLKTYLKEYEIPYYYDEEIGIDRSPIVLHISNILKLAEFFPYPLMLEDISLIIKIIPNPRLRELINSFENFVLRYNSNISKLIKKYPEIKQNRLDEIANFYNLNDSIENIMEKISTYIYYDSNTNIIKTKVRKKDVDFFSFVYIMEKFIMPMLTLVNDLRQVKESKSFRECIYVYIQNIQLEKMLEKMTKLSELNRDIRDGLIFSWNFLLQFLFDFSNILDVEDCSIYDFRKLLELTSSNFNTNRIPAGLNQVYISSPEKISQASFKYIFVIQAQQDSFPYSMFNKNRYFKLDDYKYLPAEDFIYPVKENRVSERLIAYNLFQAATNHICFTYGGNFDKQSNIFNFFKEDFLKIFEDSSACIINDDNNDDYSNHNMLKNLSWNKQINSFLLNNDKVKLQALLNNKNLDDNLRILSYVIQSAPQNFTEEDLLYDSKSLERTLILDGKMSDNSDENLISILFPKDKRYSISQLELYTQCPLQYFYKYGLNLNERLLSNIDARLQGTVTHAFWENIFKEFYGVGKSDEANNSERNMKLATKQSIVKDKDENLLSDESDEKNIFTYREQVKNSLLTYFRKLENDDELERRINKITKDIGKDSLIEANMNGSFFAIKRIIKQTINAFIVELETLGDEAFYVPKYFEWTFGSNEIINKDTQRDVETENNKIKINIFGGEAELQGKIDRIDKLSIKSDLDLFRVVDYKIGRKEIDFDRIIDGADLQLLVYIFAFEQYLQSNNIQNSKVKDAVYFLLDASTYTLDKNERDDIRKLTIMAEDGDINELNKYLREIQSRSLKQNSLEARVLEDLAKLVKKFDIDENLLSEIKINQIISMLKDRVINKCADNIVSIQSGNFAAKPYYHDNQLPCKYCNFRAACRSCDEYIKENISENENE